ncbi:hypothetical protein KIL84_007616 [Mauremys mutica]|uniref:Uncharacterized protein n=1 Tax=Mauremys mutica TaxID=74926 RepID=A0A9D3X308_9SAUR|nr:hypothetical protein KIL84_007616 [Mauremys mutica]
MPWRKRSVVMERGFQEAQLPPCQPCWGVGWGGGCAHSRSDQSQEECCPVDMCHSGQCMDGPASLTHVHPPQHACTHVLHERKRESARACLLLSLKCCVSSDTWSEARP